MYVWISVKLKTPPYQKWSSRGLIGDAFPYLLDRATTSSSISEVVKSVLKRMEHVVQTKSEIHTYRLL
ncbi:hypothetical protein PISMIDRAFT_681645 [Pisolithus microcarpus 441]|uniref:Uncharacterized protein n=1 Tax=Pisolithus microcarpus 441 TaxID=765257 RepID=A0A0C9YWE7_9AGAM|nr:hypothetical protein PISMIDRAFT_681645 [Pisolithus microcarpus 441]